MDGLAGLGHVRCMSLISLIGTLIVIGIILWLINSFIPMQGTIKRILNAIVVICVVIWLLQVFGVLDSFSGVQVPRLR
jgi:hypothetical protein